MPSCPHIVMLGGSISGNRGAESMLVGFTQLIREAHPNARLSHLSVYPASDREAYRRELHGELRIVDFAPKHILTRATPASVLPRWGVIAPESTEQIRDADLFVDMSGVSFVAGRGFATGVYNALSIAIPSLCRTPILKCSQAFGPFSSTILRTVARRALSHVDVLVARGQETLHHLQTLNLRGPTLEHCADLAFAMQTPHDRASAIDGLGIDSVLDTQPICVSASSVVNHRCAANGVDYVAASADAINRLLADGHSVLLLAHSSRPNTERENNNDLPVCARIARTVGSHPSFLFVDQDLDALTLRALIARGSILIASRFHAMVSALSESVPPLVVGWSHKYREVLADFAAEDLAYDYSALSGATLYRAACQLLSEQNAVRARIAMHLPAVRASAQRHARIVTTMLETRRPQ